MKKIRYILLLVLSIALFQNCDEEQFESDLNYVAFSDPTYQSSIDPESTATIDITVYTSTITGSDRVVNLSVDTDGTTGDPGSYTLPASVTIPANTNKGVFTIALADVNLDCSNDLVFNFMPGAGLNPGNSSKLTYYQKPNSSCANPVSGTLDFVFDAYASEISYQILDVEGNVVVSGPATPYSDGDGTASIPVTLCNGRCYSLVVKDSFGDGLASPGEFTLTIGGTPYATGGGNFGTSITRAFQILN